MTTTTREQLLEEKRLIDARMAAAMDAIFRKGADRFPGLTRLSRRQQELAELLASEEKK